MLDVFLSDVIDRIPSSKKYTLLYVTSPRETEGTVYRPDEESYQEPLRTELRRDYSDYTKQDSSSNKSLFQEYQYLTPGMFTSISKIYPILTVHRPVHGLLCCFRLHYDPVCWNPGPLELGSPLCGVRERYFFRCAEETAVIWS